MSTKTLIPKSNNGTQRESFQSESTLGSGPENEGSLTEMENLEGVAAFSPGEADKEVANPQRNESTTAPAEMEEPGQEAAAPGNAVEMDAYFASYSELLQERKESTEVIIGPDNRVRINPTTAYPWRAICALKITAQDGSKWIGTGWLVGPRTVITAGHCVYMHDHGGWPRSVEVIPGANDATRPYGSAIATTFRSVNGWINSKNSDFDYGAIILPENSRPGDRTGWFGLSVKNDGFLKNAVLNLSGYPGDKGGNQQWFMSFKTKSVSARRITYDIDTMGGQSGSPVWIYLNGQRYAVGIHTNGHSSGNSATRLVTAVYNNLIAWKNLGL
jgi:glutamyl endopeptidase